MSGIAATAPQQTTLVSPTRDRTEPDYVNCTRTLRSPQPGVTTYPRMARPGSVRRVFTCLYREGRRGIVREPEGIATPLTGRCSESTWSKH